MLQSRTRFFTGALKAARLLLCAALTMRCSSPRPVDPSTGGSASDAGQRDAGPTDAGSRDGGPSESEWATQHLPPTCAYAPGQHAEETVPATWPTRAQIPIDHIVVLTMSGRSFDHYFSSLTNGSDVAAPTQTNPDGDGGFASRFHASTLCFADLFHSWSGDHQDLDVVNGTALMDGFVRTNNPDGQRALGYYTQEDLPYYYALAQTFAMSDRHFGPALGPSIPNLSFLLAGTSFGLTKNTFPPDADAMGNPYLNLMSALSDAQVTWTTYGEGVPPEALFLSTYSMYQSNFVDLAQFTTAAAQGTLPAVSFLGPGDSSASEPIGLDEHLPADPQVGQAFVAGVVQALMTSPQWSHSALFITYDQNGGLYDHVVPPAACAPDAITPDTSGATFDQYGFRVPLIVVSPYAKRAYVSHHVTDHASILRFIETRFGLPAFTRRDANAEPLFDLFDFGAPNISVPSLPAATVDESAKQACLTAYPPH
jgi:phospholipase C